MNREFIAYVREGYPRRFWAPGIGPRDAIVVAAVLRMADTLESLMLLLPARKDLDAAILLRSLFEQMIRVSWVLIEPFERIEKWEGYTAIEYLKQHRQLERYGIPIFESNADLAAAEAAEKAKVTMPGMEVMAGQVDQHWSGKIDGLYPRDHPLSFHGLYQLVYRTTSASVHGSLEALHSYVTPSPPPPTVHFSNQDRMIDYVLGAPIFGIALTIAGEVVDWIDTEQVRRFVNRASAETTRRRERRQTN
jgi:hypothetical protein